MLTELPVLLIPLYLLFIYLSFIIHFVYLYLFHKLTSCRRKVNDYPILHELYTKKCTSYYRILREKIVYDKYVVTPLFKTYGILLNGPIARWRYFTTTTRESFSQGFPFIFQFGSSRED